MQVTHLVRKFQNKLDEEYFNSLIFFTKSTGTNLNVVRFLPLIRTVFSRLMNFKFGIIHLHYWSLGFYLYLKTIGKLDQFIFVFQLYEKPQYDNLKGYKKKMMQRAHSLFLKRASAIIFHKKHIYKEYCRDHKKYIEKFFLIETGFTKALGYPNKNEFANIIKVRIGDDYTKDFEATSLAVEAFSYLSTNYSIVTSNESNNFKQIKYFAENLHLKNRLDILESEDIQHYKYNIFLDLNKETLTQSTLNNLANGIWVVGSRSDICVNGYHTINTFLPKIIAAKIKEAVQLSISVDMETLNKFYTWESRANQLVLVYNYILENKVK